MKKMRRIISCILGLVLLTGSLQFADAAEAKSIVGDLTEETIKEETAEQTTNESEITKETTNEEEKTNETTNKEEIEEVTSEEEITEEQTIEEETIEKVTSEEQITEEQTTEEEISMQALATEEEETTYIVDDAMVSNFNKQSATNFSTSATLIVGKSRHAYLRFDITDIDAEEVESMILELKKSKGGANTLVITQASEYLSEDGIESEDIWTTNTITYNNRPLDLEDSAEVTASIPSSNGVLDVDITDLLLHAKENGQDVVTLHMTTKDVNDSTISASEFVSSRSTPAPCLQVNLHTDEKPVAIPFTKEASDYYDRGTIAQKMFRIKDSNYKYLQLNTEEETFDTTENSQDAAVFTLYIFDYTEYEYGEDDIDYTKTFYAIKCLDNEKYLSIQNYFKENDSDHSYYNLQDGIYTIKANAEAVNWNERFNMEYYEKTNRYTIGSHLQVYRDNAGYYTMPLRMDEKLCVDNSERSEYYFQFEDVEDELLTAYQDEEERNQKKSVRVFQHPGITHSMDELKAMKEHIENKEEPWYSDYQRMQTEVPDNMADYSYKTSALVGVGRGDNTPDGHAIVNFEQGGNAAYFNALQWVITGDDRYAQCAVDVLNDWAYTLKVVDGRDRILGASINSFRFMNAAEILKYYDGGYAQYSDEDFAQFQYMLLNVIYPTIEDLGAPMMANGNWDTAAMISMISIGVVCDKTEIFDRAVNLYQDIHVNGSIGVYVSEWGQSVESFRDQAHAQLGIGYMAEVCQVANNQDIDLFGLFDNRLAKAFNWAAQYNLYSEDSLQMEPLTDVFGNVKWTTIDSEKINRGELRPVYELPLAHYENQSDVDVTWIQKAAEAMRPQGYVHNDNLNFGTLTTYNGEVMQKVQPYFQMRTRLEPWYQRTWNAAKQYGEIVDYIPETLNSYFTVSDDDEITASSKKTDATFYQLLNNEDGTYAIRSVENNKYLSIKEEKVNNHNVIKADASKISDSEKFVLKCTGAGFYYLEAPFYENRIVYVDVEHEDTPTEAVLTLRLGTNITNASADITNYEKLILIYNTKEVATDGIEDDETDTDDKTGDSNQNTETTEESSNHKESSSSHMTSTTNQGVTSTSAITENVSEGEITTISETPVAQNSSIPVETSSNKQAQRSEQKESDEMKEATTGTEENNTIDKQTPAIDDQAKENTLKDATIENTDHNSSNQQDAILAEEAGTANRDNNHKLLVMVLSGVLGIGILLVGIYLYQRKKEQ